MFRIHKQDKRINALHPKPDIHSVTRRRRAEPESREANRPSANLSIHRPWEVDGIGKPDSIFPSVPFLSKSVGRPLDGKDEWEDKGTSPICVIGNLWDSIQTILVTSPIAFATLWERYRKTKLVNTKLTGLHFVPGITNSTPFVSPANQKWYCMTNSSKEHLPTNMNPVDAVDRRVALAFLSTTNAKTGRGEIYGCQALYANLLSCINSNPKNQTRTSPETTAAALTVKGHVGLSVSLCSRTLMTRIATSIPMYVTHKSNVTRNVHSWAAHCMLKTSFRNPNRTSSSHSLLKNHVTRDEERKILHRRKLVYSLYREATKRVV